jgi:hypothetical protein
MPNNKAAIAYEEFTEELINNDRKQSKKNWNICFNIWRWF